MTYDDEQMDALLKLRSGMVFEFQKMTQAVVFAAAVRDRFNLASRVFDDDEATALVFVDRPIWEVDRPIWEVEPGSSEWDAAFKLERQIEQMAEQEFGGEFAGT